MVAPPLLLLFALPADLVGKLPGHLPADEEAAGARVLVRGGGTGNGRFHRRKPALGVARSVTSFKSVCPNSRAFAFFACASRCPRVAGRLRCFRPPVESVCPAGAVLFRSHSGSVL